MSADGGARPPAAAETATAVWLWDPARRRAVWLNAAACRLWGARDAAAFSDALGPAIAAAMTATAEADGAETPAAIGPVSGRVSARRVALPDGRTGLRATFLATAPEPPEPDIRAAAFEAAPAPLAILSPDGALLARNAAFRARFPNVPRRPEARGGQLSLEDAAGRRSACAAIPLRAGAGEALLAPAGGAISADALARIAHEFRSPLTAVLGFAEFLGAAAEDTPPERLRGYLDDLLAAARRMRRLADDLVALGADAAAGRVAEASLDAVAEAALRLAAPAAASRGVALTAPAPSGVAALVDAGALERALANLIDNAIRHGRAGGRVAVGVRRLEREGGAALEVADDGPGLDAEALARALEPYGRGAPERDGRAGGLGLPIVREIAESQGGRLEIETAPGRGLLARIVLPPGRVLPDG
jgi:signal transduction histidine kinase